MPYITTEGQRRFLKRKYAAERELERACDCRGCDKCAGFVRNCHCDDNMDAIRKARKVQCADTTSDATTSNSTSEFPF